MLLDRVEDQPAERANGSKVRTSAPKVRTSAPRLCLTLAAVVASLWVLCAVPAYLLVGPAALAGSALAAGLCLLPGCGVLAFYSRAVSPERALAGLAAAMLLRLGVSFGGGVALYLAVPALGVWNFLVWLAVFYGASLLVETVLVLRLARGGAGTH